jgi:hypothetical protein
VTAKEIGDLFPINESGSREGYIQEENDLFPVELTGKSFQHIYFVEGKRGPYQRTNAGAGYTLDFYACVSQRPYYTDMGPSPCGAAAQRQTDIFRKPELWPDILTADHLEKLSPGTYPFHSCS